MHGLNLYYYTLSDIHLAQPNTNLIDENEAFLHYWNDEGRTKNNEERTREADSRPEMQKVVADMLQDPEILERRWPPNGNNAEMESLISQFRDKSDLAKEINLEHFKSEEFEIIATEWCKEYMPNTPPPSYFSKQSTDYGLIKTKIKNIIDTGEISSTGSPGYPFNRKCQSNGEYIKKNEQDFICLVMARVFCLANVSYEETMSMTPMELVENNLQDYLRVKTKSELHSKSKVDAKRWRIIFMLSIVDNTIERLIWHDHTKHCIQNWKVIPAKPGMGFKNDDVAAVIQSIKQQQKTLQLVDNDLKMFDISIIKEFMMLGIKISAKLCGYDDNNAGYQIALKRGLIACKAVIVTSNGSLWSQSLAGEGINKSGRFITSYIASLLRIIAQIYMSYRQAQLDRVDLVQYITLKTAAMVAGDDCVESKHKDSIQSAKEIGLHIKAEHKVDKQFEFCSSIYDLETNQRKSLSFAKAILHFCYRTHPVPEIEVQTLRENFKNSQYAMACEVIIQMQHSDYSGQVGALKINFS